MIRRIPGQVARISEFLREPNITGDLGKEEERRISQRLPDWDQDPSEGEWGEFGYEEQGNPMYFSWVDGRDLAGMEQPGLFSQDVEGDLHWLKKQGVKLLVSLTEQPTSLEELAKFSIELSHIPIVDYQAPTQEQIKQFIEVARTSIESGKPVAVHCAGGIGRTGTMLASWFVAKGLTAEKAIKHIRLLRPHSVETEEQEKAIREFASSLKEQ